MKSVNDKLNRKEKEASRLNEKIQKMVSDIHKLEEINKYFERKCEKEEAEAERLRHMLNYLNNSMNY